MSISFRCSRDVLITAVADYVSFVLHFTRPRVIIITSAIVMSLVISE